MFRNDFYNNPMKYSFQNQNKNDPPYKKINEQTKKIYSNTDYQTLYYQLQKAHKSLEDDFKKLDDKVNNYQKQIFALQAENKEFKKILGTKNSKNLSEIISENQTNKMKYQDLKKKYDTLQQSFNNIDINKVKENNFLDYIGKLQYSLEEKEKEIISHQNYIIILEDKIAKLEDVIDNFKNENENLKNNYNELIKENAKYKKNQTHLKKEKNDKINELEQKIKQDNKLIAQYKERIVKINRDKNDLQNKNHKLLDIDRKNSRLKEQIMDFQSKMDIKEATNLSLNDEIKRIKEENEILYKKLRDYKNDIDSLNLINKELIKQIEGEKNNEEKIKNYEQQINDLNKKIFENNNNKK